MHIWTIDKWKKHYYDGNVRRGMRLKFDNGIDGEVRRSCKDFCQWLRTRYYFPIRVPIYIKNSSKIRTFDNDLAYGTFFEPKDHYMEPYIRVAAGDYEELLKHYGKDNALAAILLTIAHELTHYFQWINDINLTEIGMERQATSYAQYILEEYKGIREHP